jgi:hypothetical protein
MKVKVRHGDHAAVFALFDNDVQNLAIETCPLLISMVCFQIQCSMCVRAVICGL